MLTFKELNVGDQFKIKGHPDDTYIKISDEEHKYSIFLTKSVKNAQNISNNHFMSIVPHAEVIPVTRKENSNEKVY